MPVKILNLPGLDEVDFRETATEYHVRANTFTSDVPEVDADRHRTKRLRQWI